MTKQHPEFHDVFQYIYRGTCFALVRTAVALRAPPTDIAPRELKCVRHPSTSGTCTSSWMHMPSCMSLAETVALYSAFNSCIASFLVTALVLSYHIPSHLCTVSSNARLFTQRTTVHPRAYRNLIP